MVVSSLDNSKYAVIYTTTPRTGEAEDVLHEQYRYEMDDLFPSSVHTELRRDVEAHASNGTSDLPLFEKYQFLSPGVFSIHCPRVVFVGVC